jgi:hypothetical protein
MSALAICLSATTGVRAAETLATQAFADSGTPQVGSDPRNLSPTGDVNTATVFSVEDLVSTTSNSGALLGMPPVSLGGFIFNLNNPPIGGFPSNQLFGSFTLESLTEPVNNPDSGFATLLATGVWVPGTWAIDHGLSDKPYDAQLRISFTQTPSHTGAISASGTFAVPAPAAVPEPSSIVLVLTGLAAVVTDWRRRRQRAMA